MVKEVFFPAWVLVSSFAVLKFVWQGKNIYIKCVCLHSRWIINYLKQKYVPFFDLWNMGMWYLDLNINDTHVHVCIWLYDFDHMF